MPAPFRIRVYDKAFSPLFQLGAMQSISVTCRHLAKSTGSIALPIDHPRTDAMLQEGTRVTIDYLTGEDVTDDASWLRVMSGPLWTFTANGPLTGGTVTFGVEDDYRVLDQILGWAKPTAAIGSQTDAYDVRSGDAETVIKAYVTANATRLGLPLTVATNGHRGATVKGNVRFDRLSDVLPQLALVGGLGITVNQVGTGLVLDVYVPTVRTRVLSEAAGTVTTWALTRVGPSATRVVIAAQGVGAARAFTQATNSSLESLYGTKVEAFVDARDTNDSATLTQRGVQALTDGAPQAGFSLTVAETDVVRYGKNLLVGDVVPVQITPTLALSDVLSEATIAWTKDKGLVVTPQVGQATSAASPDAIFARALSTIASKLRKGLSGT